MGRFDIGNGFIFGVATGLVWKTILIAIALEMIPIDGELAFLLFETVTTLMVMVGGAYIVGVFCGD